MKVYLPPEQHLSKGILTTAYDMTLLLKLHFYWQSLTTAMTSDLLKSEKKNELEQ